MALQDAARDIAKAHFCVPPHFKPPKEVPTTFRAPSVSLLLRTPVGTTPSDGSITIHTDVKAAFSFLFKR